MIIGTSNKLAIYRTRNNRTREIPVWISITQTSSGDSLLQSQFVAYSEIRRRIVFTINTGLQFSPSKLAFTL